MGLVERGLVPRPVARVAAHARRWSLWALPAGEACCQPEIEAALRSPRLDAERLGVRPVTDPAAANVLVVGGPVTAARLSELRGALDAMPHPRYVMAVGACALSGAPFTPEAGGLIEPAQLPIDVYVPGCPPRPEAILHGIEQLQERIIDEDPAERWRAATAVVAGPLAGPAGSVPGARSHRGAESVAERAAWEAVPAVIARLDESGSVARSLAFSSAVEQLAEVAVPPRAGWVRALLVELAALRHSTGWFAGFARLLGLEVVESLSWRAREHVLDAFDVLTGSRIHGDAIVAGGVRLAPPESVLTTVPDLAGNVTDALWDWTRSLDRLLLDVDPVAYQLRGAGVLASADARALGLRGPNARASSADPAGADAPLVSHPAGDAFARCWVRVQDARAACRSLRRLAGDDPGGALLVGAPTPPPGFVDAVAPHPEGLVHCTVVSDGGERPWRVRVHGPGVAARAAAAHVCGDPALDDRGRVLVAASFAPSHGDADR